MGNLRFILSFCFSQNSVNNIEFIPRTGTWVMFTLNQKAIFLHPPMSLGYSLIMILFYRVIAPASVSTEIETIFLFSFVFFGVSFIFDMRETTSDEKEKKNCVISTGSLSTFSSPSPTFNIITWIKWISSICWPFPKQVFYFFLFFFVASFFSPKCSSTISI